jgi:general secretion pathway protein A
LSSEAALLTNQFSFDLSRLRANPFDSSTCVDHPYLSSSFREGLAALYYGLEYGSRIVMVVSDPGLGKTTLLRHFERRMQDRRRVLFITSNSLVVSEVLGKLLIAIGGTTTDDDLSAMGMRSDEILTTASRADSPFILLLDHENVADHILDVLRRLTNFESFRLRLLRIIIAASPGVAEQLERSEFAQEIRRVQLFPLTAAEVESYIEYRLRMVGWSGGPLFTAKACELITERSSGKPSSINEVCSTLLHNLSEPQVGPSANEEQNQDGILDEYYVDLVTSGRKLANGAVPGSATSEAASDTATRERAPDTATPDAAPHTATHNDVPVASSRNHRTAILACVVLVLVLSLAGLWYHNAVSARWVKHVTVEMMAPFAASLHHSLFHSGSSGRSTRPAVAASATGVRGKSIIGARSAEEASQAIADGNATPLPPPPSPAVFFNPSPTPGRAATIDMAAMNLATGAPAVISPSPTAQNNPGEHPPQSIRKRNKEVVNALSSQIAVTSRAETSAIPPTAARTAASPKLSARTAKDVAHRAAEKMASNEIKRGDAYVNMGDYEKAARSFSRAIAIAPGNKRAEQRIQQVTAYEIRRGDAYMDIGDYDEALRSFSKAVAFAPDNREAQERVKRARRAKTAEEAVLQ